MICKPSRVVYLQGVPDSASEDEILQLGLPFGQLVSLVWAKQANQALLEMADVSNAQAMVSYYTERCPQIRGQAVYVQFSNHAEMKSTETLPPVAMQQPVGIQMAHIQQQQQQQPPPPPPVVDCSKPGRSVLRVIVENMCYQITIDILKQIFARYGQVLKIVTFTKNNTFQALIQFSDAEAAHNAKTALNGSNIYYGCCTLRIDFSKLSTLNVRYNNEKSRDYTDPTLSAGNVAVSPFSVSVVGYGSGPRPVPTSTTTTIAPAVLTGHPPTIAYCLTSPAATSYDCSYGSGGLMPATALNVTGLQLPWAVTIINPVVLVTNIADQATPDDLFTLFGVYGDVVRVKIMYNKKDKALIQFADGKQAQQAIMHLDKAKLWSREIKVSPSKHFVVQMPKDGQPDSGLTKDYTNSPLHRFKRPNSKNYNNIYAPSATLHLSNIPSTTTDQQLVELFAKHGSVLAFKFFESDHKMALVQMGSVEEATHALMALHNHQLAETSHLRVSFSKSTIGSSTATAAAGQQHQQIEGDVIESYS
jgi:polypyrimidine tract-binding protein 2